MILHPPDDRLRLAFQYLQIMTAVIVIVACQREILPDHDPLLITQFEKAVLIYVGASPAAQHIHMRFPGTGDERFVSLPRHLAGKYIRIYKIGPLREHRSVVQNQRDRRNASRLREVGRLLPRSFIHTEPDCPETYTSAFHIAIGKNRSPPVERRFSAAIAPPQLRV